jgi:hypothetical protein
VGDLPGLELLAGERQAGESDNALIACNDWLRMGPGRTLPKLLKKYGRTPQDTAPTDSINTLEVWSKHFHWAERATAYDAEQERLKNLLRQIEFARGATQDFVRTRKLRRLLALLEKQLYEKDEAGKLINLWLQDFKQIGGGEFAEKVEIERFNAALVEQLRGVLDDLARETGGRRQGIDASVKTENELTVRVIGGINLDDV